MKVSSELQSPVEKEPLPRVVLLYDPRSISPMVISEGAAGICRIIWVVDSSDEVISPLIRLLRRLGDVVDSAGLDPASLASALRPLSPQGIATQSDSQMPLAADLAERLSLVFHSASTAACLADKYLQRRKLRAAGVPGPNVWEVSARVSGKAGYQDRLAEIAEQANFPVVVKPRRSAGSVATARANNMQELLDLISRIGDRPGGLLIEEYLQSLGEDSDYADDISVEMFVQHGTTYPLVTLGKFKLAPPFRGRGNFLPSHLESATTSMVFMQAELAVAALGIRDGFVDIDIKLTPAGPRVVEVNGRIGGNVPELVDLAGGPRMLPLWFKAALGDDVAHGSEIANLASGVWDSIAYFAWVQPPMSATRVIDVAGFDNVAALCHTTSVIPNRFSGDAVDWSMGGITHVCAVYGAVSTHSELVIARAEIDAAISLQCEHGPESESSGSGSWLVSEQANRLAIA